VEGRKEETDEWKEGRRREVKGGGRRMRAMTSGLYRRDDIRTFLFSSGVRLVGNIL
jgi:hypothetical protein